MRGEEDWCRLDRVMVEGLLVRYLGLWACLVVVRFPD